MRQYITRAEAKRQRLCEIASSSGKMAPSSETMSTADRSMASSSETMSTADRAFEVFMRWYLDERIHQVIDDHYQIYEVVIRFWEYQQSLYHKYPSDTKELLSKTPDNAYYDPESNDGWSDRGRKQLFSAAYNIYTFNDLLINSEQLPVPLIRRTAKMEKDSDGIPLLLLQPSPDALVLVEELFKNLENVDLGHYRWSLR